ncbi:MAG: OmpA family protein [Saprospiraceae bacterium]|nr:OmpA family protein [Saprospiraceae bacterium]
MPSALIEQIITTLDEAGQRQLADWAGIEVDSLPKALQQCLAAAIVMIANKAQTDAGARGLMDFATQHRHQLTTGTELQKTIRSGDHSNQLLSSGSAFVKYLAGDRLAALTDHIAARTGLSTAASLRLIKCAAPLALGTMHQHVSLITGDERNVKDALLQHRAQLDEAQANQISDTLGLHPAVISDDDGTENADPEITLEYMPGDPPVVSKLLPWVVLLLTSLALLYFVGRGCSTTPADMATDASSVAMVTLELPDGGRINTTTGSCIAGLYEAMRHPEIRLTTPFTFDSVTFEPGTTILKQASLAEIDQLLALMQAFPTTRIRLEGHTDNTGNARNNLELSTLQAEAIKSYLQENGIDRARIRALGRGQTKPVSSNSTDEGKAANRRVEIYLTD